LHNSVTINVLLILIHINTRQNNFRNVTRSVTRRYTWYTLSKSQFVFVTKTNHIYAGFQG